MYLDTAKAHFDEDMSRAQALVDSVEADQVPMAVSGDVLRAAWMMGVGALDAYFSDAYADLVARTLRAKERQPTIEIPDRLNTLKIPVLAVLNTGGWKWRMAARELIEDENVLSIKKIRSLFNHFFLGEGKIISNATVCQWMAHRDAKRRCFGMSPTAFRQLTGRPKSTAVEVGMRSLMTRFEEIFQRRHDCIHNCDRPRIAIQTITVPQAKKVLVDITFLVSRCQEIMKKEYLDYLRALGFSGVTRNAVTT